MRQPLQRALLALGIAALVGATGLEAQRGPQGRRGGMQNREQLEQRIRAQMGRMVRQQLGLDDEQAARLSEVVEGFEEQRGELVRLEQATRRRVEALMLEGGTDQAEAAALVERMSELRAREAELFAEEQDALLTVLTPMQVLRYQALRQQIGQRIRALRGGRGDQPGRRRPAGAGVG